jgi:hypothetical protein
MTQGVGFHGAARGLEPGAREIVVDLEARELVPGVVHRIDLGLVRTREVAAKLKIVGRIGEDEIDRGFRQLREFLDAIADDDAIVFETGKLRLGS